MQAPLNFIICMCEGICTSMQKYTSEKPLLTLLDFYLFSTKYRCNISKEHLESLSVRTSEMLNSLIRACLMLALCLSNSILQGTREYINKTKKKPFFKKIIYFILTPRLVGSEIGKSFNSKNNENKISSKELKSWLTEVVFYLFYVAKTVFSFIIIPLPKVSKAIYKKYKDEANNQFPCKINFKLRTTCLLVSGVFLTILLILKDYLMRNWIDLPTYFITLIITIMFFFPTLLAPAKKPYIMVTIYIVAAVIVSIFCCPIVFAFK